MEIMLQELVKTYATRTGEHVTALADVSIKIQDGEFVSLVGPSGCGKTTLLNIVAGLLHATEGRVILDGEAVGDERSSDQVGLIFQKPVLLPWRTAFENVYLPAEVGREPASRARGEELRARARQLLATLGLEGFEEKHAWELSGGMQQRVAIARALLLEARIMCMDEPFAALDEFTREQMHVELLEMWRQQRFTGVFVTHNIFESVFLSDRVLVMTPRPGRVVAEVAVDLPRPRTRDMLGSDAFAENVRRIRTVMEEHWDS